MTLQDFINWLSFHTPIIISFYAVILGLVILGYTIFKNKVITSNFIKYIYSFLVYSVSVPAVISLVLLLYLVFFINQNILNLNIVFYFLPLIASIITLIIINKTIKMDQIPGFKKLSGLFTLIIITFFITYLIKKMFFGVIIVGSFGYLIIIFIVVLIIAKIAIKKITK